VKPIDQTKLHKPGKQKGNCMNAAFASLMEIQIEDIPKFEDMPGSSWYIALTNWLYGCGFELLRWDYEIYLGGYFIANGPSPRGFEHSVVYKGTEMVHDPHPSRGGLEKVTSVWALLPLDPSCFTKYGFIQHGDNNE